MIALDTSVLVRYLAQDDARQAAAASRLIEQELSTDAPAFVSLVTMCEISWVLARAYRVRADTLREVILGLAQSKQLVLQEQDAVVAAARALRAGSPEFSDLLAVRLAADRGCEKMVTFDRRMARFERAELLGS